MKRIIFILATIVALASCSCKENGFDLKYDFTIDGDASGNVDVYFPNGNVLLNGDADIAFEYGNMDTTKVFANQGFSAEQVESFTAAAEEDFAKAFEVTSAGGVYDLTIRAVVTETMTGIKVNIDKRFTNKEN